MNRNYSISRIRIKDGGGGPMKGAKLILLGLAVMLALPNVVFPDCLTFGNLRPVSWYVLDEHTLVFYEGTTPIALVRVQDCRVSASSSVRLIKRYLCDSDRIIVDNAPCSIMTITSASSGSF